MLTGEYHAIAIEERGALLVDVLVGEYVYLVTVRVKPVHQLHVTAEVSRHQHRLYGREGPKGRRVSHAAAIHVLRIDAQGRWGPERGRGQSRHPVREVAVCGHDERDPCGSLWWRRNEEGNVEGVAASFELGRVHAALGITGDVISEANGPAGVAQVVLMEVESPVLLPGQPEVQDAPVPVVSGDRARRQIDGPTVVGVSGNIDDSGRGDAAREVPIRQR